MLTIEEFKNWMRIGRIITVDDFPEARNPSYKLSIDLAAIFRRSI